VKLRSTFKEIEGSDYNEETINSNFVLVVDHFSYYDIDYSKSKEELLLQNIGQNKLIDNCIDPKHTTWLYDSYIYVEDNFDKIYIPIMDLNIKQFNNSDKPKLSRKYKFVTFNNKARFHRIIASSWINQNFESKDYFYTAGFNVEDEGIGEHLLFINELYPGLPKKLIGADPFESPTADTFLDVFYPHASDAVFNIVNDVSFWEYGCHLSEKTFWSFLAYNIPIISGYGMATSMERIGFDMFTDIVNYTSEFITNPFDRTFRLLNDNKDILKNAHEIVTNDIIKRLEFNRSLLLKHNIREIAIKKLNTPKMIDKLDELVYNKTISKGLIV
tara:strand:- start:677 stop:1666 length:990 start_codon:yes stop_codon:yes gene_type:complete